MTRSMSRTLEYSYNISQIGSGLGKREGDVEKYPTRSGNWKNLFKADQTSINASSHVFEGSSNPPI
jgi:putative alpha-1,2-mannosidase